MTSDADPTSEAALLEAYRQMTPAQKFAHMEQLNKEAFQMAAARIKQQYGEMSDRELRLRIASLTIDRETMIRAFGWDPDVEGAG